MKRKQFGFSGVIALLLVMILVLATACGGKNPSDDSMNGSTGTGNGSDNAATGNLVFWTPFGGGDYEFMKQIVDDYNETNPNFTVEIISKEWATYYQGLNSALIANSGPDIFIAHQSKLAELIPTGKLQSIRDINNTIDWDTYAKPQLDAVTVDGIQYSVPLDTHAMVMFYNNEILGRAGVTSDDLGAVNDLDSFNAILDKISKVVESEEHVLDVADSGENTIQQFWLWYVLNAQAGGEYITSDGKAALNSAEGIAAMDIMNDWNAKGYLKNGIDDGASYDIFKSGKAAINFTGVWATGNYETSDTLDFGVMPIPAINGSKKTWGDSHTMAIPTYIDDAKKEAALAFADWVDEHAVTWARAGHVPVKKSVVTSDEYLALPYRSDYMDVINDVVYYPSFEMLGSANDIASVKVNEAFLGKYSVQEALDKAADEINSLVQ